MLAAIYFDGKTATPHPVSLTLDAQDLLLCGVDFELRCPLREVRISERLGNTPRMLTFAGGNHCEVTDHAALDALLANGGIKRSRMEILQNSPIAALLATALLVVAFLACYRYLLPWGVEVMATRMPDEVLHEMSNTTLETLDSNILQPSKLTSERQQALTARFAELRHLPDSRMQYRIVFRSAPTAGPNAFALPDGTLVLLDELVAQTRDDNEIAAVLAHESGHVERRHAMRMVLHSSAVGLVIAWYIGDFSSLLAAVPAVILEAGYSRDMEREADEYAKRTLLLNGLSPCLLTSVLAKLEAAHREAEKTGKPAGSSVPQTNVMDYLSSHPPTAERAALLCPSR